MCDLPALGVQNPSCTSGLKKAPFQKWTYGKRDTDKQAHHLTGCPLTLMPPKGYKYHRCVHPGPHPVPAAVDRHRGNRGSSRRGQPQHEWQIQQMFVYPKSWCVSQPHMRAARQKHQPCTSPQAEQARRGHFHYLQRRRQSGRGGWLGTDSWDRTGLLAFNISSTSNLNCCKNWYFISVDFGTM